MGLQLYGEFFVGGWIFRVRNFSLGIFGGKAFDLAVGNVQEKFPTDGRVAFLA